MFDVPGPAPSVDIGTNAGRRQRRRSIRHSHPHADDRYQTDIRVLLEPRVLLDRCLTHARKMGSRKVDTRIGSSVHFGLAADGFDASARLAGIDRIEQRW